MVTAEQKRKNCQYILNNLDKYVLDSREFFVNSDFDTYRTDYYCIGIDNLNNLDYFKIKREMAKMIIRDKNNWKIVYWEYSDGSKLLNCFENRNDGRSMPISSFEYEERRWILGELGYRKGDLEDYEEGKFDWRLKDYKASAQKTNNKTSSQPSHSENKPQTQHQENLNQDQGNQNSTHSEIDQPQKSSPEKNGQEGENKNSQSNNYLPSVTNVQNQYNSDQDKSAIENDSNLINNEQKEQAEELLKVIILAELLIKEKKFNQELLTKLIKEKDNNTPIYQLLNKENRTEQAIDGLARVKKSQESNNNSVDNNKNKPIIIFGGLFLVVLGLAMMIRVRNRKQKSS